jgi:hypothetical protein
MQEIEMRSKKGKNFKEVIDDEKNKGRFFKKTMKILTGIDSSVVYGGSFLLFFAALDVTFYFLLAPGVFMWAGILVGTALVSSVLASKITKLLKKQQWKYASFN